MADSMEPFEAEIDAVLAEHEGDPRAAIRALLHDLAVLARDGASLISRGYVRGRWPGQNSIVRPEGDTPRELAVSDGDLPARAAEKTQDHANLPTRIR